MINVVLSYIIWIENIGSKATNVRPISSRILRSPRAEKMVIQEMILDIPFALLHNIT